MAVTATHSYKITLRANSGRKAIAKARRIWNRGGEKRFIAFGGEADDWFAQEERS